MISIVPNLRLMNDATPRGDEWWEWRAWIEAPDADLDRVRTVTYLLHPTFTPHKQTVSDRSSKFTLVASAWGEFLLAADVHFSDGTRTRLERWLELGGTSRRVRLEKGVVARRPRVFLSGSLADAPMLDALTDALSARGIEVLTHDSFDESGSFAHHHN